MKQFDYLSIVMSFFTISCAVYIFYKKRHEEDARFLSYFILLSGFWMMFIGLTNLSATVEQVSVYTRLCVVFSVSAILFFLLFVSKFRFPDKNAVRSNILSVIGTVAFVLVLFASSNEAIMSGIEIVANAPPKGKLNGFYSYYFMLLIIAMLVKSAVVLLRGIGTLEQKKKRQIQYVVFGGTVAILGGSLFDAFLPWILNDERFYSIGPLFFVFFIGCTSYAIIRHQLLDIKFIIQRGLIYSILVSIFTGLYLAALSFLGFFYQQNTDSTIILSAGITMLAGIYGAPKIEKFFQKMTDKIFFKDKYDYSEAMFLLSEALNRNLSLEPLLKEIARSLNSILRLENLYVILPMQKIIVDVHGIINPLKKNISSRMIKALETGRNDILDHRDIRFYLDKLEKEKSPLYKEYIYLLQEVDRLGKEDDTALSFAVLSGNKLLAIVALGPKLSGEDYSDMDKRLLKTFAFQAAIALEKTDLFEQVRSYSEELEDKIKRRTEKIQGLQEVQKQMMLEIAHGLQTPLTIINTELEYLEQKHADCQELGRVKKSIGRISHFIYDMLRLSKLEAEESPLKSEKIDLSALCAGLIEEFEVIAGNKGIEIKNEIEGSVEMEGNAEEIEELITNLVSNSVKYIGDGKEKIIRLLLKSDQGKIILSVEDTGIGIPKAYIPRLFDRFFRVEDAAHMKKKGTGLGLAICKRIAERHNGEISVESGATGSIFTVVFKKKEKSEHKKL
jgi:signal transduction histidine kinase